MITSAEHGEVLAGDVSCTRHELKVVLSDGRTVIAPLVWFPRLLEGTPEQRADWELIGGGIGIHWEALDEDISVASLLQPGAFMRLPDRADRRAASRVAKQERKRRKSRAPARR